MAFTIRQHFQNAPLLDRDTFVCGPAPFMKMTTAALKELDFPRARRHQEKFVSLGGNPFGDSPGVVPTPSEDRDRATVRLEVELDGETHVYDDWNRTTTMLDHLESRGLKAPYSCRAGECSACAVRLVEGEVSLAHNDILDADDLAEGIRLACQATATSDVVRATYS